MAKYCGKKDRTARLLKIQMLLSQHPDGLKPQQIALECSVSKRTIYRDIETLERELDIPLWVNQGKYGVSEGHFLSPIVFSTEEAMNIFMAARLMQNVTYQYNPSIVSTFAKLNTIVPAQLREKIQNTLEFIKKQPVNERKLAVFNTLTRAWLAQKSVRFEYLERYHKKTFACSVDPYVIEPSVLGHSSYLIGYCHEEKKIRGFKLDTIIGNVIIKSNTYTIPFDFDAANYISSEWDVHFNQELVTVKLRFHKENSERMIETRWHPSQQIEKLNDGTVVLTFKVREISYFRAFILGFGDDMEVLEPESLREQIREIATSLKNMYRKNNLKKSDATKVLENY